MSQNCHILGNRVDVPQKPVFPHIFKVEPTSKAVDDCSFTGSLKDKDFQKFLIDSLLSIEAGNLILDPLISYHGEDENDNADMLSKRPSVCTLTVFYAVCLQIQGKVFLYILDKDYG